MILFETWWQQSILEAMKPGAVGVVLLTVIYWVWKEKQRREESRDGLTASQSEVSEAEVAEAADGLGLLDEWKDVVSELKDQNKLLRDQNKTLVEQNDLLRARHNFDTRQLMLAFTLIDEQSKHIRHQKPPPGPPWPEGLERLDYYS